MPRGRRGSGSAAPTDERVPRVVALRVPWFAAAAQCRREPALAGQPLVLGAPKQGAWRVAALSAAAAAAGVRVGMPLAQAESMCPAIVRRPLDLAYLAHESERLLAVLEAHVAVEPAKPGSALFGGQGMGAGGWGAATGSLLVPRPLAPGPPLDPQRQLAWLVDALAASTGYVAAVGVADGRGAAAIAARRAAAGAMAWVPPGETAAYLAPLPAAWLPVSAEMRRRLELLGLRTIGALAALPVGAVQAQFGPEGRLAWEIAHGRDRRPLAPRTPPCIPSAALALYALRRPRAAPGRHGYPDRPRAARGVAGPGGGQPVPRAGAGGRPPRPPNFGERGSHYARPPALGGRGGMAAAHGGAA
ncbi:MAG TPA: hypothetical protein VFE37_28065 [Chloroflexota bacterium]|nr:hypothetical protein [Chloroflexota bacterium]